MAYLERWCPAGPPCQQWHDPATFIIIIIIIIVILIIMFLIIIIIVIIIVVLTYVYTSLSSSLLDDHQADCNHTNRIPTQSIIINFTL